VLVDRAAQHRKPRIGFERDCDVRLGQLTQLTKFETEEDIAFSVTSWCHFEIPGKRFGVLRTCGGIHHRYEVVHDRHNATTR